MIPAPHLNEYLKRFLPVAGLKPAEVLKAIRVPYLTLGKNDGNMGLTEDDAKLVGLLSDDNIVRCPFDEFRYCMDFGKDEKFQVAMFGWAKRSAGSMKIVNLYRDEKGKLGPVSQMLTVYPQTDAFTGGSSSQIRPSR